MVAATTLLLGVIALMAVVYAVGVETTQMAVARGAGGTKKVATSTAGRATAGFLGGVAIGEQLLTAALMEPFAVSTMVAGIAGALGIEGMLGGISGIQFLLIGVTIFAAIALYKR